MLFNTDSLSNVSSERPRCARECRVQLGCFGPVEMARKRLSMRDWGRKDNLPAFPHELDRWFTELPANFDDALGNQVARVAV